MVSSCWAQEITKEITKGITNVEMGWVLVYARAVVLTREQVLLIVAPRLPTRVSRNLSLHPKAKCRNFKYSKYFQVVEKYKENMYVARYGLSYRRTS